MQVPFYEYLDDREFLKQIDLDRDKEFFVKIIALDWNTETPLGELQGKTTSGSINISGSSSMRRTGSLSLIVEEGTSMDILSINSLISINKKISVTVGYTNHTNLYRQHNIIWFDLGVFVITSASISNSASGLTVSVQLNDKMALLNGSCGGTIPAATTFDSYNSYNDKGELTVVKVPIFQLIKSLVHEFGGEEYSRIIINDIPDRIEKVMKWMGNSDLAQIGAGESAFDMVIVGSPKWEGLSLSVQNSAKRYHYGEDVGYLYENFYFPEELSCGPGDTVTSVLDKIKNALGNYEYFYDVHGNFIFQEIKNYLNTSLASINLANGLSGNDYLINRDQSKSVYTFADSALITSYANNPKYGNVKNDFIIWGQKKLTGDSAKLIHYHLAIDTKPTPGNEYFVKLVKDANTNIVRAQPVSALFYPNQAAMLDSAPHLTDIYYIVEKEVVDFGNNHFEYDGPHLYRWSNDLQSFIKTYDYRLNYNSTQPPLDVPIFIRTHDWREELYFQGVLAQSQTNEANFYYKEMSEYWPKIFDLAVGGRLSKVTGTGDYKDLPIYQGAYKDVEPSDLEFYIDFIDSNEKISELSVRSIGHRIYAVSDENINCVFAMTPPDFVLVPMQDEETMRDIEEECIQTGLSYVQVDDDVYKGLALGGVSNPAFDSIRSSLHQYTSYNESISISAIPVYYLEANTRITVEDNDSGIHGDYMIESISLPLDVGGTMSLSCTKALERL